jgi:hypothetical protein
VAAFGESCRRCGHCLTARFDPERTPSVHRSIRNHVDLYGGRKWNPLARAATGDNSIIADIKFTRSSRRTERSLGLPSVGIGRWISDTVRYRMLGRLLSDRLLF